MNLEQNEKPRKGGAGKFIAGLIVGFLAAVLVTGYSLMLYYGKQQDAINEKFSSQIKVYEDKIETLGKLGEGSANPIVTQEFADKVGEIYDLIDGAYYFEDKFNESETQEKVYAAIMDSIGDKYSRYYTAKEWESSNFTPFYHNVIDDAIRLA